MSQSIMIFVVQYMMYKTPLGFKDTSSWGKSGCGRIRWDFSDQNQIYGIDDQRSSRQSRRSFPLDGLRFMVRQGYDGRKRMDCTCRSGTWWIECHSVWLRGHSCLVSQKRHPIHYRCSIFLMNLPSLSRSSSRSSYSEFTRGED